MKNGKAWVGDQIRDEDSEREGIVTDVRRGTIYILRPLYGPGQWENRNVDRLTVTVPLSDRDWF
ncbi:hypothetical protein [Streptomyces sp. NPDC058280]|uniref:hypothetical protein n=1 Tax=Streptomyces sp. NPDC058280 TaxID=3346419 RepID=UPI0036EB53EB